MPIDALAVMMFPLMERVVNEGKVFLDKLEGYRGYTRGTTYRLIPGVW